MDVDCRLAVCLLKIADTQDLPAGSKNLLQPVFLLCYKLVNYMPERSNHITDCECHSEDKSAELLAHALELLAQSTLRITGPRRAMLEVLAREHGPFTIEEIHAKLAVGTCDLVTLYRSLAALEELGIVRRCDFGDGAQRFEIGGNHHHHIICRRCHSVQVVEAECLVEPLEQAAREAGFSKVSHALEIFGICPRCSKADVKKL